MNRERQVLPSLAFLRAVAQRLLASVAILLVIAYLTLLGLVMAERGQRKLPTQPLEVATQTLARTVQYVTHHPDLYRWNKQDTPSSDLVLTLTGRSVALLALALGVATLAGVPVGVLMALSRRTPTAPLLVLVSVLGVSTPSFLLGMFFWAINVYAYQWFGFDKAPLPQIGFGWDTHLVMPTLVLATRPLAQVIQVTYVSMSNVLRQDYIQVAHAKGLGQRVVVSRHALRNALIPVLTTLSTSLRFALASLPVVEMFFHWPGMGSALLEAIAQGQAALATDLIVSLGVLFLAVNLLLEALYPLIDPRLKENTPGGQQTEHATWQERWDDVKVWASDLMGRIRLVWRARRRQAAGSAARARPQAMGTTQSAPTNGAFAPTTNTRRRRWRVLRFLVNHPALVLGSALILGLFGLAFLGEKLAHANPYQLHGLRLIDGVIHTPPYKPMPAFPWGTDLVGRDVQGLVLAGAKRTLTLALAGMTARISLGMILGVLAGWWQNSWLDKLVRGAIAVWAAFPLTLFAMIVILALGIQKGMWVFVVAMCVVGWGETAQFMREQVIGLKPLLFVEAARAVGARPTRILRWHILPHLFAPLLVLAILEMGGVLMLLAELGFLNVFLGGGFKLEITTDYIFFFSDVPEWGALLANIHRWWRAYPWIAWYPGLAFFAAILAFNLWGEGMRRWLDETRLNVARLANRYTLLAVGVLAAGLGWSLHSSTPIELYKSQAACFDPQAVMQDIAALSSPEFSGRESGTWGANLAAQYIAARMREIGVQPAGEGNSYFQSVPANYFHLGQVPRLEIGRTSPVEALVYRQDFVEYTESSYGWGRGEVVGLAFGPPITASGQNPYRLGGLPLRDKVILVREAHAEHVDFQATAGVLIVGESAELFHRRHLPPRLVRGDAVPVFYITPQAAERLLAASGGLAHMDAASGSLQPGQVAPIAQGFWARMAIEGTLGPEKQCQNVIGVIPGSGASMTAQGRRGMDSQVILVSANYDGLGMGPEGSLYPGANDNASGVAAMLELARVLVEGPYTPIRTVVLVAGCDGERGVRLDVRKAMSAKRGFNTLTVESVIELEGLGGGSGAGLAIQETSTPHLAQLVWDAAGRMRAKVASGPTQTGLPRPRYPWTVHLSWAGADTNARTPGDSPAGIDVDKLRQAGQTTTLVLTIISRELEY
ncbi:MAG: ABC transporter permease subunit [Thermoflexales bacterium]|nr:ABC transporter permease subunit [Thermoflexales bacterium]